MSELSPAPRPTEDRRMREAARVGAPKAEAGEPETDVGPIEPPATASAGSREGLHHGSGAPRPLDRTSAPGSAAPTPAAAGADATARAAMPGLLRDVDVRVVPAVDAAPGAQIEASAEDALTEAKQHWRALGERLRASYPPTGGEREQAGNGEASARSEAAELPFTHRRALPTQGKGEAEATPRRSEMIIRHLEIRIVAAANERAPAAENRPPAPDAGAWQTAARHYLRL
jgi:hypothetical protein